MSIKLGSTLLAGVATNTIENAHSLLDFKWTDHILNEMSWLRADTFSWQSGAVYVGAYNHILADYNGGISKTETVGSYTITYVEATDGHKITTDESTVANIYAESGVAWYYVLDTTNTRFKLPRINPAREELIQVVRAKGNGMTVGFTDGTTFGGTVFNANSYIQTTGNAYGANVGTLTTGGTGITGNTNIGITTDSTKSGVISDMKDSTFVYKGKKYLYFYVGNFSQSATEQTAGLNSSLFNGKADIDLSNAASNASSSAKETIVGWGTPDYSAGVSKTWNTDNTAESSGIVIANDSARQSTYIQAVVNSNTLPFYEIASAGQLSISFPVCKGDVWKVYGGDNYGRNLMFYPMKGVSNA